MKIVCYPLLMLSVILALTGCAAGGAKFTNVESAPPNKGLIYFYRPKTFAGSAEPTIIKDNDKAILKIQNGQYVTYLADPGHHNFHTDTMAIDKSTKIEVEAGQTYFIKTNLRLGVWVGTMTLNRVYESEALEELQSCKGGE